MKKITLLLFAILSVFHVNAQVSSYSFSQSDGTYTPLTSSTVLATQTVASGTAAGALDDVNYTVALPFSFTYNGVVYASGANFYVNTNGFVSFGAAAPTAATYGPIGSTNVYDGAISGFGLDANGGYAAVGSNTTGSPDLTITGGTTSEFIVGAPVAGTGIPAGATVVSTTPTTVTLSVNCTSTGTARTFHVGTGQISYQVLGSTPNQKLVVQFTRMRQYNTTLRTNDYQIVLNETTNAIDIVYGFSIGSALANSVPQVGLRGATNAAYNNRTSTTSWAITTAGTVNTSTITFNSTVFPASGLTFSWTPPIPCAGIPTPGIVTPANLSVCIGALPGNLVASGYSTGVTGLAFQWEESLDGVAWADAVGGTGATTATYTPPAYSGTPIQYRLKVTCTNSGLSDFSTPALIGNPANPSTQVSNVTVLNPWLTTATVNWTNGNGGRRVVMLSDSPTFIDPTNGNAAALVANATYTGSGQQIVYDGAGATVAITGLTQATNYYVKVYEYLRCGADPYDYYYNTTTGTNTATITTLSPPSNDLCEGAIPLTVGVNFAANQLSGTLAGAATTAGITPSCQASFGLDVWYTVTVPASGNLVIETQVSPTNSMADSIITVYSGACGTAQIVGGCDDDGGPDGPNTLMSKLTLTGRTPGEVLYVAVWKYQPAIPASTAREFLISAYDCPSATPAPTGAANQTFCSYNNPTVANLVANGDGIKWYDASTAGNLLLSTDALVSGNIYYASQTVSCESFSRLAVTATINTPVTPTGSANQTFCSTSSPTLASLAVTGTDLIWYDDAIAGNVLPTSTVLTATTYYVASNDGTCESSRLEITTTEDCPFLGCLNAPNGQWPGAAYTPDACDGLADNVITPIGYAGEYSTVNVVLGQTYVFKSSIATDIITISADGGTTAAAYGTTPVTWVSTIDGQVRFYTHVDNNCVANADNRTRSVICGIPSAALPDYVSLQWPPTATIAQGGSVTVYGQVYEGGLTDVAPNINGQAPGINAWVGYSTTNTNPNTWTNWVVATHNAGNIGNNDEYQATIGATLAPGTYYYATRFNLDNGAYVYGGINANTPNNGNFWDGATFGNGVLTVTPPPAPANDDCSGATVLVVDDTFCNGTNTNGTNLGSTDSGVALAVCFNYGENDVWYSFVAPSDAASVDISTDFLGGTLYDTEVALYSGTCGALTEIDCDDDGGVVVQPNGFSWNSLILDSAVTANSTYYVRVSGYGVDEVGTFCLKVSRNQLLSSEDFNDSGFTYYPNPVKNILNLSYSQEISSVEIYNLLGQRVSVNSVNSNEAQIDMSNLPSAAYVVKVTANNQIKTVRVIKE